MLPESFECRAHGAGPGSNQRFNSATILTAKPNVKQTLNPRPVFKTLAWLWLRFGLALRSHMESNVGSSVTMFGQCPQ